MSIDFTPLVRPGFVRLARRTDSWDTESVNIQKKVLRSLLERGADTEYGKLYGFRSILRERDYVKAYRERVPLVGYEELRPLVMRMIKGERDVLWRGVCVDYAQSSGTSGGKSKFIPVTGDSLRGNHYRGAADSVAHYLRLNPRSRMFAGKGFILGGSFSNTLGFEVPGVHVGDLSATLIRKISPLANLVRVPDKKTALLPDWEEKLPALVKAAAYSDITNISGVPSWFLTVIRNIVEYRGVEKISDVWPNLEVFFHGGISFEPYRDEYRRLTDSGKMHFLETYNASEGFFAVQNDFGSHSMLLIIDRDVFYEFIPVEGGDSRPRMLSEVKEGEVYEMVISSSNGLWRYRLGDTVRIAQATPVKITIAGRTKSFINAFGEELMEDNAERAMAAACDRTGASIVNYTAAPQFASKGRKGRHQWLVEWGKSPSDNREFAAVLDEELRKLNSDYDAKRSHSIFLDMPEVISAPHGLYDRWLKEAGNHKLGGQRKVPRLSNDRNILDKLLSLI
ncbi:MAG: GH3 auxin-responsive promoter family protein [Muribaculaceae bacterium]|nr:GH3 auxin-responsive promoter family protein [Muribaculaceae bacterium]